MWSIIASLGKGIVDGVSGFVERKQKRKSQAAEFANAVHLKQLENIRAGKVAEAEWNHLSIKKAGWRPGFLTILLSAPMALVFFPPMVPYIEDGFVALNQTPDWYRVLIGVMVSSAFGVKKLADHFMNKKYTLGN